MSGSNTGSLINVTYNSTVYEAEVIEFWMRIYTPTLVENRTFVSQDSHFNFSCNNNGVNFTVQNVSQCMNTLLTPTQLSGWFYVAGVIGFNSIKCFLIVDDSTPFSSTPSPGLGAYQYSNISFLPNTIGTNYLIGIKEFKIWLRYKTFTELQSGKYTKPSVNAPCLALYLPLDESTGTYVTEKISKIKYTVDDSYWYSDTDYLAIGNGQSQYVNKKNVALMLQDAAVMINLPLTNTLLMNNEFTFMIWFKMSDKGQLFLNVTATATANSLMAYIDLNKAVGFIETIWKIFRDTPSGQCSFVPGQWQSYAYSVAVVQRLTYANGVNIRADQSTVFIIYFNLNSIPKVIQI